MNPGFDDKHGFTAYNLPDQGASTTHSLGRWMKISNRSTDFKSPNPCHPREGGDPAEQH